MRVPLTVEISKNYINFFASAVENPEMSTIKFQETITTRIYKIRNTSRPTMTYDFLIPKQYSSNMSLHNLTECCKYLNGT